jgi:hypothetical protein
MENAFVIIPDLSKKTTGNSDGIQAEIVGSNFIKKEIYDYIKNQLVLFKDKDFEESVKSLYLFPAKRIDLEYVSLSSKNSKITNFISYYPSLRCGPYLVTNKLMKLLNNFSLPSFRVYQAKVYPRQSLLSKRGNICLEYLLFYSPMIDMSEGMDFGRSIFSIKVDVFNPEEIKITSMEDYLKKKASNRFIVCDKAVLKRSVLQYDFFNAFFSVYPIVSGRLKEEIMRNRLNDGILFKKTGSVHSPEIEWI